MCAKVIAVLLLVAVVGVLAEPSKPTRHPPPTLPTHLDPTSCPPSYKQHPLILVSVDGFRSDYLRRGLTPTLEALVTRGVHAPYMKPSYPTITFPNHYTLVTGLYPPSHGIIANKFYDPEFRAEFRPGRPESFKERWWGGEPIWKTVENQGKIAATFFWPGSEVEGLRPTHWFYYNESIPFNYRANKVLSWLELPEERRPSFITLYMHEPDNTGHDYGPNSPQIDAMLMKVDELIGLLIRGLQERDLLACVNLLVVADHGMAESGINKVISINEYVPDIINSTRFWDGAFARFEPNDGMLSSKNEMMEALSCKRKEMRVYARENLPVRWHMGRQRRVEGVVVEVDPGYTIAGDDTYTPDLGEHGYDNYFHSMNALFVGYGPDLMQRYEVEAFHNTDLYNLMCALLKVSPANNNGTWGALHHLLTSPPQFESPPKPNSDLKIEMGTVPSEMGETELRGRGNGCEGGDDGRWVDVLRADQSTSTHQPWGIIERSSITSIINLNHQDAMTAYSPELNLPRYTSFNIGNVRDAANCTSEITASCNSGCDVWYNDVRIPADKAPSCAKISNSAYNISRYPIFPSVFSSDNASHLPCLISNAVPFSDQLKHRWDELTGLLIKWQHLFGPLNIVSGPVFDYDADSLADDFKTISVNGGDLVPTHMFLIVTRCIIKVSDPIQCPEKLLDVQAFIYPQNISPSNCLNGTRFAQEFSVRVVEVEKITGLHFFSSISPENSVKLRVRMHSNLWGKETWWDRLLDNFIE